MQCVGATDLFRFIFDLHFIIQIKKVGEIKTKMNDFKESSKCILVIIIKSYYFLTPIYNVSYLNITKIQYKT